MQMERIPFTNRSNQFFFSKLNIELGFINRSNWSGKDFKRTKNSVVNRQRDRKTNEKGSPKTSTRSMCKEIYAKTWGEVLDGILEKRRKIFI